MPLSTLFDRTQTFSATGLRALRSPGPLRPLCKSRPPRLSLQTKKKGPSVHPPIKLISNKIHFVRGKAVMWDQDLAKLYRVETKRLNRQVKRNLERFPEDFMFQLTHAEVLRCQNVTLLETAKIEHQAPEPAPPKKRIGFHTD